MESDSSDSEEEFLTTGGDKGKGGVDREALVRRKLLESFYGTSGVDGGSKAVDDDEDADSENYKAAAEVKSRAEAAVPRDSAAAKDLDSPYFDAAGHTAQHVANSSLHNMLETDEKLTLQVRTLDSTMQTLVYENYSRFIEATDAIRSIGVNVQANEQGLQRLNRGMQTINDQSRAVEEDLGSLRDAVAEKIRVKRLLTRLDALLKLPSTLREKIAAGRYRTATTSFLSATSILSKHSAGFESLKTIETECNSILFEMVKELKRKILHWSGHHNSLTIGMSTSEDEEDAASNEVMNDDDDDELPTDPPKTVSEIFECAGTLVMLIGDDKPAEFNPGFSLESCKEMSMAASARLLDRLFDSHHLELQEAEFSTTSFDDAGQFDGEMSNRSLQSQKGNNLIPTKVVDAILESATLFGISFGTGVEQGSDSSGRDCLMEFVSDAFASFLAHVRMVLVDHSTKLQRSQEEEQDDDENEVSGAMSILLHTVRELASGLALPEVGIDMDFASDLVDQAIKLTESMVRRRVDQKFCELRLRVIQDCLVPFVTKAVEGGEAADSSDHAKVIQLVQMAGVALSDCLQLVDDTVRSIASGRLAMGSSATSVDLPTLKVCIQASTGRFAKWLAGTLEVIAGCESSDAKFTVDAAPGTLGRSDEADVDRSDGRQISSGVIDGDDISEISMKNDLVAEKVDSALQDMLTDMNKEGSGINSDFTLAICEMCRLAERTVIDNMNQSIESHVGGKKSKPSGLFQVDGTRRRVLSDKDAKTTERFRLAASRTLVLYACNGGFHAANLLCDGLRGLAIQDDDIAVPREAAWRVLETAKIAAKDCADIFGGSHRAAAVPAFAMPVPQSLGLNASPLKGLQLDVERMFKEKTSVYPHPSTIIEFSRDAVLTIMFKVAFKALAEHTRQCTFSGAAYTQLQVDIMLLRHMIPHYVKDSFTMEDANACSSILSLLSEAMSSAGDRCLDDEYARSDETMRKAGSVVNEFLRTSDITNRFIIPEE